MMRIAFSLVIAWGIASFAVAGTQAEWLAPVNGNWTDSAKWSSSPFYPQNGSPVGTTYDARVTAAGAAYSITLGSSITLDSFLLNSADVTLMQTAGGISAGTFDLQSGTYDLRGGFLSSAFGGGGSAGHLSVGPASVSIESVTLGIDMDVPGLSASITVSGGLTLSNHNINFVSGSRMTFGQSTLGGTGQVIVNSRPFSSGFSTDLYGSSTLTIGPDVTVRTGTYSGGSGQMRLGTPTLGWFVNEGTVSAQTANMQIELRGNWTNTGTLIATAGRLVLGGHFTPASIGRVIHTGGSVWISGDVDATGQTLRLDQTTGSWDFGNMLSTAQIHGGRIEGHAGAGLRIATDADARLDRVTLAAPLQMDNRASLRVFNSLTLDGGTIEMSSGLSQFYETVLDFTSPTVIDGTGEFVFQGAGTLNQILCYNETGPVSFGDGITIRADTGGALIRAVNGSTVTIAGDVISGPGARQITFYGPIEMNGRLHIDAGGTVPLLELSNLSSGVLSRGGYYIDAGSTLRVSQPILRNAASILLSGANSDIFAGATGTADALGGLAVNDGVLKVTQGRALSLIDDLSNSGTLLIGPGSTIAVGGDLTLTPTSRLVFELDPVSLGELKVGNLFAEGTLEVMLADGFTPSDGAEFDLMDFLTLSGTFATVSLPPLSNGKSWDASNLSATGAIRVVPEPALCLIGLSLLVIRPPLRGPVRY
jgi:hypothetical protein